LSAKSIDEIYTNIKDTIGKMKSKVFSFDYFIRNPKLESFVHKRWAFKMLHLNYTIDEDDIADLSFSVKLCFMNYGVNADYKDTIMTKEKITYSFEFYTDEDLKNKYNQRDFEYSDEFIKIRFSYDKAENKDLSIHHICDYVLDESRKCFYRHNGNVYNFFGLLNNWIRKQSYLELINQCKQFYSTQQIKNWFYKNLLEPTMTPIYLDKANNEITDLVNLAPLNVNSTKLDNLHVNLNGVVNEIKNNKNDFTNSLMMMDSTQDEPPNNVLPSEKEQIMTREIENLTKFNSEMVNEINSWKLKFEEAIRNNKTKADEISAIKIHLEQQIAEKNCLLSNMAMLNSRNQQSQMESSNTKLIEKALCEQTEIAQQLECVVAEKTAWIEKLKIEMMELTQQLEFVIAEKNACIERLQQEIHLLKSKSE
jgi:hypothetical protein